MSDFMRGEFEQRFPVPRGVLWRDGAYHREKEKQCTLMAHLFYLGRWEAWRASREHLVVELPNRCDEHYQDYYEDVGGGRFSEGLYIQDVHAALTAAGVKYK